MIIKKTYTTIKRAAEENSDKAQKTVEEVQPQAVIDEQEKELVDNKETAEEIKENPIANKKKKTMEDLDITLDKDIKVFDQEFAAEAEEVGKANEYKYVRPKAIIKTAMNCTIICFLKKLELS